MAGGAPGLPDIISKIKGSPRHASNRKEAKDLLVFIRGAKGSSDDHKGKAWTFEHKVD